MGYTQSTFFVAQHIGALPEGRTLPLWRKGAGLNLADSADGACQRERSGVSLLCRAAVLGAVVENDPILFRMPYSGGLYSRSAGGAEYDR